MRRESEEEDGVMEGRGRREEDEARSARRGESVGKMEEGGEERQVGDGREVGDEMEWRERIDDEEEAEGRMVEGEVVGRWEEERERGEEREETMEEGVVGRWDGEEAERASEGEGRIGEDEEAERRIEEGGLGGGWDEEEELVERASEGGGGAREGRVEGGEWDGEDERSVGGRDEAGEEEEARGRMEERERWEGEEEDWEADWTSENGGEAGEGREDEVSGEGAPWRMVPAEEESTRSSPFLKVKKWLPLRRRNLLTPRRRDCGSISSFLMPRNVKTPRFHEYGTWHGWTPESAVNVGDRAEDTATPVDFVYDELMQLDGSESLAHLARLRAHSVDDVLVATLRIIALLNRKNRSAHIAHEIAATTGKVPEDYDDFEEEVEALYQEQQQGEPESSEGGEGESQLTEDDHRDEEASLAGGREKEDIEKNFSPQSRKRSSTSVDSEVSLKRPRLESEEQIDEDAVRGEEEEEVEEEEVEEPSPEPPLPAPVGEREVSPAVDSTSAQYEQLFDRFSNGQLRKTPSRLSKGAPYTTRSLPIRSHPRGPKPTRCAVALLSASLKISSALASALEKRLEFVGRAPAASMQRRMLDEAAMLDALYQEQSVLRDAAEAVIQIGNGQAANDINRDEMSGPMRDALAAMRQAERKEKGARELLRHALQ